MTHPIDQLHLAVRGNRDELIDGLLALRNIQVTVSRNHGPIDVKDMDHYTVAMIVEWTEFLQELNWKSWKPARPIDADRLVDEFADTMAFLGIIIEMLSQLNIGVGDLVAAYLRKSEVNVRRFTGEVDEYRKHHLVPPGVNVIHHKED